MLETSSATEEARMTAATGHVQNVWMMWIVLGTDIVHKDPASPDQGTTITTTTTIMEVLEQE